MKRLFLIAFTLSAVLAGMPADSANAADGRGHNVGNRHGIGHGHGRGHGIGFGIGGFYDDGYDLAELYRELLNNVPYYALHPPVYYSQPVPRTYGYSPFAYPPHVMTPEVVGEPQPLTIDNPYVPSTKPAPTEAKSPDRSAEVSRAPEPLVIINPFVTQGRTVARSEQ